MTLAEKITEEIHEALKARASVTVSTLRLLLSALRNKEIQMGKPLSEEQALEVVAKEVKQRRESITEFEKVGRKDLAGKEQEELEILSKYLPAPFSTEELASLVTQAVQESLAKGPADFGKVMKVLMPRVGGRADGKAVQEQVKSALSRL